MNKNDVYKLIGYHGEYDANVKKAIRKLLKENHPDNKGDRKKFEVINEVKKELESGKVSYKEKKTFNDNQNIDYDYCQRMVNDLKIKKNSLNELLNTKKELLSNYENDYKTLYEKKMDMENNLLVNSPYVKKMQNFKVWSIVLLVLLIVAFILSIVRNNNVFFIAFLLLSFICIFIVQKHVIMVSKINSISKKRLASYISLNNEIKENIKKKNNLKNDIRETKRKLTNIENDLRFYKNLLK